MSVRPHGILVIDKPAGPTSFQIVKEVRRRFGLQKVGHAGTLDPFATGVLLLCCGAATKLAPYLLELPKTYQATMCLGIETDTQDYTGTVVAQSEHLPSVATIQATLENLVGSHWQTPPSYSAVHVAGRRLYEYARQGLSVTVAPRPIYVYAVAVTTIALPEVTFIVTCSKGTYIRTLAADLGRQWGCGAHLKALRRLQVGPFTLEQAIPTWESSPTDALLQQHLIPLVDCLPQMPAIEIDPVAAARLRHGQAMPAPSWLAVQGEGSESYYRLICQGELVAVATLTATHSLQPVRVLPALDNLR